MTKQSDTDIDLKALHNARIALDAMLEDSSIQKKTTYRPCEVQVLLNISAQTFRNLCDCWEPPDIPGGADRGLECYMVRTHRRVRHQALVEWLARNQHYYLAYGVSECKNG